MALRGTYENLLLGESHGDFHYLRILRNGTHQDINAILNGISGGGGGGAVSSAQLPLSIANGVLSIDLTAYSTTSAINTLLAGYVLVTAMANYSTTTAMNVAITTALTGYVTSTALTNVLASYTDTTALATLLASKLDTLSAGSNIIITGSGTSRTISASLAGYMQTSHPANNVGSSNVALERMT